MPSAEDRDLLTKAFYDDCIWPSGQPRLEDAWLGIYQLLLWYAHGYIHIREANDLRKNKTWQQRAKEAEEYIAGQLGVPPAQVAACVDRMMQLPRWRDAVREKGTEVTCPHCGQVFVLPSENQRNNPLGNGLRILTAETLRKWGDPRFDYEEEALATRWFPGITMPGRSAKPKIDVLVRHGNTPRVVVSCKWSIRHDRISDPTNECTQYKKAALDQQIMDFKHYVITNELDGQRADKVLNQPCIDGLVMVHLPLVRAIGRMTQLMERSAGDGRLLDLTEFVKLTYSW